MAHTVKTLAALVSAVALGLPAAVSAQGSQGSAQGASQGGPQGSKSGGSQMARGDRKMIEDLMEANAAEIQTGQLAMQKAQSPEAKQFAQKMIDDHTKALKQVRDLAQAKGVPVKDDTDLLHKGMAKALDKIDGDRFDSQYMKRIGVDDHKRTERLLQKAQKDAKDPELKALAAQMLPTVQQHLQMAQQNVAKMDESKGNGSKGSQQTAKR